MTVEDLIGRRVRLSGHFPGIVRLEGSERLDSAYQLRVRTEAGALDEALVTADDLARLRFVLADDPSTRAPTGEKGKISGT